MPAITTITLADIKYACRVINQNPGRYGNVPKPPPRAATSSAASRLVATPLLSACSSWCPP